jgi:hypothetical protein
MAYRRGAFQMRRGCYKIGWLWAADDGDGTLAVGHPLDAQPVLPAIGEGPVDGLTGGQADQRGADRRQDTDSARAGAQLLLPLVGYAAWSRKLSTSAFANSSR